MQALSFLGAQCFPTTALLDSFGQLGKEALTISSGNDIEAPLLSV
jgi:hypothetical protein